MAKALYAAGFNSVLLNKTGIRTCQSKDKKQSKGIVEGVHYYFLYETRKKTILSKILAEVIINIQLICKIHKLKTLIYRNFLVISYCPVPLTLYYRLIAWLCGYRLVFSIMEYHPAIASNKLSQINAYIFWRFSFFLADGAIPISRFLSNQIKKRRPDIPLFDVPVLADFNHRSFAAMRVETRPYFLYCGSVGYYDVIRLIVEAFLNLEREGIELHLVISGETQRIQKLKNEISQYRKIKLYQKLSYDELYNKYACATGLLIPMRPNKQQDRARFPQKIAEYSASGSPIITNSVGEIATFFKGGFNAVFADEYSIEAFTSAMLWVLNNPTQSKLMGLNGKKTGWRYFHYESIAKPFAEFLKTI